MHGESIPHFFFIKKIFVMMRKSDSLEKILMLGKIEGKKRRVPQSVGWLDSITDLLDMYLSKVQEIVDREA